LPLFTTWEHGAWFMVKAATGQNGNTKMVRKKPSQNGDRWNCKSQHSDKSKM